MQQEAEASFPRKVDGLDNVFHCGFHSEQSFGCASYLVTRPEGNVLVDVPRFVPKLLKRIQVWTRQILAVSSALTNRAPLVPGVDTQCCETAVRPLQAHSSQPPSGHVSCNSYADDHKFALILML